MTLTDSDQDFDPEAAELRALAEAHGFVRYAQQARELQEQQRDEMERERDAWAKYEAAVNAKLGLQKTLALYFMLALSVATFIFFVVVQLIRWFL
jgi:hypothetical protein